MISDTLPPPPKSPRLALVGPVVLHHIRISITCNGIMEDGGYVPEPVVDDVDCQVFEEAFCFIPLVVPDSLPPSFFSFSNFDGCNGFQSWYLMSGASFVDEAVICLLMLTLF